VHDLVIKNALILDGTGAPGGAGSLGVTSGRISAVGTDIGAGRETIDANGLALMPGIIDGHTHYDAQVTWDPFVDPSPALGVTTAVIGNCGFTIAPCRPEDRDLTMRNLTHVEGMSLDALRTGIRWDFESFADYMAMLERQGVGPNIAAYVGHSAVRTFVLRDAAAKRTATDAEIAQMADIVRDAMAQGAIGFATSTNEPHNGEGGIPMPSRLADDREMRALVKAMGEGGRGMFMLTKGSKTSVPYLETLAADSGRPVLIAAMLHSNTNPGKVFEETAQMDAARARGNKLYAQVSPCPLTMDFTLHSPYVFESVDSWKPAMEAHGDAVREVYKDPGFRQRVKDDLVKFHGMRLFNSEWDKVHVVETRDQANREFEGKSVELLAKQAGQHPLDWLLDLGLKEDLDTVFTAQLKNSDSEAVGKLINDPETHVALSDAGAHLTFFCDAGYGLHLLGHWARDLKAISLEQAVRKLTGHPAQLFGIRDRGVLRAGAHADLLLFDPQTIARGKNERVFDLPGNAARLRSPGFGIHGVWVNGKRMVDENGLLADAPRAGAVLREFDA
jgi:N-acyl-D-amino-acid deacylase